MGVESTVRYDIQVIENEWIVLPDGRRLAARLWLPKGIGPFPTILEYLPYQYVRVINDFTETLSKTRVKLVSVKFLF